MSCFYCTGIGVAFFLIVAAVVTCILYRRFRINKRNNNQGNHINNGTHKDMVLNSTRLTNADFKRSSKLSNLEVSQVCPVVRICIHCYQLISS